MTALRATWLLLFVIAIALTVFTAWEPVSTISMGCSKIGEFSMAGAPAGTDCDSPIHVLGVWRLVALGALLSLPALIGALWFRRWASWTAFAAYICVSVAGLMNWTGYWGLLLQAVPMALVALILALVHQFRSRAVHTVDPLTRQPG